MECISTEGETPLKDVVGDAKEADAAEKDRRFRLIVFRTIVQLTEPVGTKFLLQKLNYLDVNSWMEVIEERYIGHLCGFPTCSNRVEMKRAQKYRIDRKNKKVFERSTDRDKFCSDRCFMRSSSIRIQLAEEPLWIRGMLKHKKFTLDDVAQTLPSSTETSSTVEFVQERVEKQLVNLFIGDSHDTDEEKGESDSEVERKKDDDTFASEISNFISYRCYAHSPQKPCASAQASSLAANDVDMPCSSDSNKTGSVSDVAAFSGPSSTKQLPDAERLARIRSKYSSKKAKSGPIIVEAKPLDSSLSKKAADFEAEHFRSLIKDRCGSDTLNFLRWKGRSPAPVVTELTETEKLVRRFYAGDQPLGKNKDDDVVLPKVDAVNQDSLRRDVFARILKPSCRALENKVKVGQLYERFQPLIGTLSLNAANVDLKQSEARLFTAFLFRMLAYYDENLKYSFLPEESSSSTFQDFVEDAGCGFSIFETVTSDFLSSLSEVF